MYVHSFVAEKKHPKGMEERRERGHFILLQMWPIDEQGRQITGGEEANVSGRRTILKTGVAINLAPHLRYPPLSLVSLLILFLLLFSSCGVQISQIVGFFSFPPLERTKIKSHPSHKKRWDYATLDSQSLFIPASIHNKHGQKKKKKNRRCQPNSSCTLSQHLRKSLFCGIGGWAEQQQENKRK